MTKHENLKCDNSNSKFDKTQNSKCNRIRKFKMLQNSNSKCDNSKTQNVTNSKTPCDKTQKLKMWQNSKTQYVTILKNLKCDNSNSIIKDVTKLKKKKLKMWQN